MSSFVSSGKRCGLPVLLPSILGPNVPAGCHYHRAAVRWSCYQSLRFLRSAFPIFSVSVSAVVFRFLFSDLRAEQKKKPVHFREKRHSASGASKDHGNTQPRKEQALSSGHFAVMHNIGWSSITLGLLLWQARLELFHILGPPFIHPSVAVVSPLIMLLQSPFPLSFSVEKPACHELLELHDDKLKRVKLPSLIHILNCCHALQQNAMEVVKLVRKILRYLLFAVSSFCNVYNSQGMRISL